MHWQLADAKNRFSELLTKAHKAPQIVRRRNEEYVVLPRAKYDRLTGKKKSFIEHLMSGPGLHDLDLTRDKSLSRNIEF